MHKKEPLFKSVFGPAWTMLPPALQKRYANRPFTNDVCSVEGEMDLSFSKVMSYFLPLFRLLHVLVPYEGKNVLVKVDFCSHENMNTVSLDRKFYFTGKPPYPFYSSMYIIKDNEVVEGMAFGLGWKSHYSFDGKKIVMQHKGYVLKILGSTIPLPLELFIGKGHAEEEAIDDNSYRMKMTMTHPWFGIMYTYSGIFAFKKIPS